jgi:quercetin dioxygenase-like cupin family protein
MKRIFPEPMTTLAEAEIPLEGIRAYLSRADKHQVIFRQFDQDVDLPEHAHADQVGFVLEGRIDLTVDCRENTFRKGDTYHIPAGVRHSGKIFSGYADITFFDEPDRYSRKEADR